MFDKKAYMKEYNKMIHTLAKCNTNLEKTTSNLAKIVFYCQDYKKIHVVYSQNHKGFVKLSEEYHQMSI